MDARWTRGIDAFNAGEFFAAHEIWEALWLDSVGPEKQLLQGLVQVAAGYAKVESGMRSGALKLLSRGVARIRSCQPVASGLNLNAFAKAIDADVQHLRAAEDAAVSIDMVQAPRLAVER
jgi:predicted metal-dependent hydrolase